MSCAGVFEAYFGKRWRATPLGMSGDTVAYLRWRLEHGELPRARLPRVAVLLVGTNDLRDAKALYEHQAGDGATVEGRAAAVLASARDIGARCVLHAQYCTMHSGAGCKRLNLPFQAPSSRIECIWAYSQIYAFPFKHIASMYHGIEQEDRHEHPPYLALMRHVGQDARLTHDAVLAGLRGS